jgi:ATP-binding cassette subfamily C (CFTR/MRP) protein 1
MFEGTLRDNLDPRHVHDDTELWSVLGQSNLHPVLFVTINND